MKKIALLILTLALIIAAFTSCKEKDREYDEGEVKAAARELIEDSILLNEIFWGKGLPYYDDRNTSEGSYYRAIEYYHYEMGFKNIDELKELCAKTFSKKYCESINQTMFSSIEDGEETLLLSRYYQKVSVVDGTPEYIMVNTNCQKLLSGTVEYDYESIKVTGSEGETVFVTINATVTEEGLEPQTREIRISLVEEESGWRIDSPTYLTYDKTNLNK